MFSPSLGALRPFAPASHGSASRLVFPRLARNVGEIARALGIGHIENGSAVGLLRVAQRIARMAAVMPDVGDPAIALPMDERLVGAAALEIVRADELHVA